ncbi:hypothetical protein ACA910_013963 [Epithemia clementina (nom. ined.)]
MPSASVLRTTNLPPRSPRVPPLKSPSQLLRERSQSSLSVTTTTDDSTWNEVADPSPQHLPAHLPPVMDADLAETRGDFVVSPNETTTTTTATTAEQQQPSPDPTMMMMTAGNHNASTFQGGGYGGGYNNNNNTNGNYYPNGNYKNNNNGSASSSSANAAAKNATAPPITFGRGGNTKKVPSTDVASVGNASDTGIPWSNRHGMSTTTTGRALHEKAKLALNAGNYDTALELFQAILHAQRKRFGKCHASVAAAMHNVGVCLQRMDQHRDAENLLAEAVQVREKTMGRNHVEVAASLSKLGSVRISLSKFEEAFTDLRRALSIAKTHAAQQQQEAASLTISAANNPALSPDHCNNATNVLLSSNGATTSTAIITTTSPTSVVHGIGMGTSSSTDSITASNKTVAQMLCHLACLYFETGEFFAAQATFQDALDIYREVWAVTTHDTDKKAKNALMLQLTDTLCNIGSVLNRRKCFAQAIGNFQEALDLLRGIVEHDHPRIISTLDNLAYSYSKNKEYARAVTCYRTMLRAQVSQSKTFNEECLSTFRKRVVMYEKLKLISEAINDTRDVMRVQQTYLSNDHPIVEETKLLLEELQNKKKKERKKQQQQQGSSTPPGPEQPVEY